MEALYERVHFFTGKDHPLEHHAALLSLFEILDVAGRADLKSEMMQELERQKQTCPPCAAIRRFRREALSGVLADIDRAVSDLFQSSGKTGQELRENEWLMGIKQRSAIPGGVCEFDLPSYHYWLHQQPADAARRSRDAGSRRSCRCRTAISIILRILRESGRTSQQMATQGVYQQMMGGRVAQLLRLRLDDTLRLRARGQRQQVRTQHPLHRQLATRQRRVAQVDIPFELTFCNL